MDFVLLGLCILSITYCSDSPAIPGFEFLIYNPDSVLYNIALGTIAAYIFYAFQVLIPKIVRFWRTLGIAQNRISKIEKAMKGALCCLQGVSFDKTPSKEEICSHLAGIDIFSENSKLVIQKHTELSVFEALMYYHCAIITLIDEVISGQYLPHVYEKYLLRLRMTKLFEYLESCNDYLPGEYVRHNQEAKGLIARNPSVDKNNIILSLDEYLTAYNKITKVCRWLYFWRHHPVGILVYTAIIML